MNHIVPLSTHDTYKCKKCAKLHRWRVTDPDAFECTQCGYVAHSKVRGHRVVTECWDTALRPITIYPGYSAGPFADSAGLARGVSGAITQQRAEV